jgi:2-amino-4-hydroxy-6-hydroxymethyldihydropteridine diphosphokinase
VYIGFGSNMGDRRANCLGGLDLLVREGVWEILAFSPLYLTEPVDVRDQDWFVNGAARARTELGPGELLARMKDAERRMGRAPGGIQGGPRPLDLDILLYGGELLEAEGLAIPHPRLHKRRFVLCPLCDIAPDLVHPALSRTMAELLKELPPDGQEVRVL